MNVYADTRMPEPFQHLLEQAILSEQEIVCSGDGFWAVTKSISAMLQSRGMEEFPDSSCQMRRCDLFFDDWYLYAVPMGESFVCSLYKMREQERDAHLSGDGDTPGVTVSFVAFREQLLEDCLSQPDKDRAGALGREINRCVAYPKQHHHEAPKAYFLRTESKGAYLIAGLYTRFLASLAVKGKLPVPEAYRQLRSRETKPGRISVFLEENNRLAGYPVCDGDFIYIRDPEQLTHREQLALLAVHTGNVSFHSFGAEVQFHARFLVWYAKFRLPFVGSPYASAVRADMSIGDKEFQGPAPYYNPDSRIVKQHRMHHPSPEPIRLKSKKEETSR